MLIDLLILLSVALSPLVQSSSARVHHTRATRYADTRRDEGGTPSCWRRCLAVAPGGSCAWRFDDAEFDQLHPYRVASRTLPCGTMVAVRRDDTSQVALGAVLDRGPFGQAVRLPGDRRAPVLARPRHGAGHAGHSSDTPLVWRGDLDLSPGVAEQIGLRLHCHRADGSRIPGCADGRVSVTWWVVR